MNTYIGDEAFQKILDSIGVTDMPIFEIKSYLLGYLVSPEHIMPLDPLDEILLKDTPSEITFPNEIIAKNFYQAYMGLWNNLTQYLGTSKIPPLVPINKNLKSNEEKITAIDIRSSEFLNFQIGLDESGASEYFDKHPELFMAANLLRVVTDDLQDLVFKIEDGKKVSQKAIDKMYALALETDQLWIDVFPPISNTLNGFRLGQIKPMHPSKVKEIVRNSL